MEVNEQVYQALTELYNRVVGARRHETNGETVWLRDEWPEIDAYCKVVFEALCTANAGRATLAKEQ